MSLVWLAWLLSSILWWAVMANNIQYNVLSAVGTTTNTDVSKIFVSRGYVKGKGYFVRGILNLTLPLTEDTLIDFECSHSSTGTNYKTVPFTSKKYSLLDFVNGSYRTWLMEDIRECCEGCPYSHKKVEFPLPPANYTLTSCKFHSLPNHLQPGYYKITIRMRFEILQLESNLVMFLEPPIV